MTLARSNAHAEVWGDWYTLDASNITGVWTPVAGVYSKNSFKYRKSQSAVVISGDVYIPDGTPVGYLDIGVLHELPSRATNAYAPIIYATSSGIGSGFSRLDRSGKLSLWFNSTPKATNCWAMLNVTSDLTG